ncbi:hypothetical protein Actkin_00693 [Actinokineospora sp. UTMC 2448]|nr:hypothetical protein Actkin_00693 [Actinokineospora sp. UTMC 2448]
MGWRGTDALFRGAVGGVGLVTAGVVLHRVDLVLVGAPLLIGTVVALVVPVGRVPTVRAGRVPRTVDSGGSASLAVEVDAGPGVEFIAVRLPGPDAPGPGPVHLLPRAAHYASRLRWDAWGEGVDLRPDHLAAGRDALLISGPVTGPEGRRTVLPVAEPVPPGPLPPRVAGLVGVHRAPRPGDGTELRAVRPFQLGDRVRRIDWRVTLRAGAATGLPLGTLHVRERHAEADADLVLALDSRVDVGAELADWSIGPEGVRPGGSLDTAVRAIVGLAAGYLRQGDRVGLVDLGRPQLGLPPGVGHRHLLRIRHQLVACARSAGWAPRPVLRAVPAGAVVVVLTPLLDDAIVDCVIGAARHGAAIVVLDVLPKDLRPDPETEWGDVVRRVVLTEHRARRAALLAHGVPVADEVTAALRRIGRRR